MTVTECSSGALLECWQPWASEGFLPVGTTRVFFQNFYGGGGSDEICFLPLESKKITFFAENFTIQR